MENTKSNEANGLQIKHYWPFSMHLVHEYMDCGCATICTYCRSGDICYICPSDPNKQASHRNIDLGLGRKT